MPDRKRVLKGLECCSAMSGDECRRCPYSSECRDENLPVGMSHLANDALELLKGQEPRLLTMEEVITAKKLDVWFEDKGYNIVHPLMLIETEMTNKSQAAFFYPMLVRPIKAYGKTWRCWTARPTDEQRMEERWNA